MRTPPRIVVGGLAALLVAVFGTAGCRPTEQAEQPASAQTSNDPLGPAPWAAPFATAAIPTDAAPGWVIDVDGSLWVSAHRGGTLDRIDPTTNTVNDSVKIGGQLKRPSYLFGSIWVVSAAMGELARVDPTTRMVTGTAPAPGDIPGGFVYQYDDMIVASVDTTVTFFDPVTMKPARTGVIVGDHLGTLVGLAAVGGDLWMLSEDGTNIYRVSLATLTITLSVFMPVIALNYVNGHLLTMTSTGVLQQIDPNNGNVITSWQLATPYSYEPGVVQIVDDGTGNGVWVNQVSTELTHLDLVTGQSRTIKGLPYQPEVSPYVHVAADGTMWAADWKDNLVLRMKS
jgi:streptogramin lyase